MKFSRKYALVPQDQYERFLTSRKQVDSSNLVPEPALQKQTRETTIELANVAKNPFLSSFDKTQEQQRLQNNIRIAKTSEYNHISPQRLKKERNIKTEGEEYGRVVPGDIFSGKKRIAHRRRSRSPRRRKRTKSSPHSAERSRSSDSTGYGNIIKQTSQRVSNIFDRLRMLSGVKLDPSGTIEVNKVHGTKETVQNFIESILIHSDSMPDTILKSELLKFLKENRRKPSTRTNTSKHTYQEGSGQRIRQIRSRWSPLR